MVTVPHIEHHPQSEVSREYKSQKLIRKWIDDRSPSSMVIPALHSTLMDGSVDYQMKGLTPTKPGVYRNTDITVSGTDPDFYVKGLDVVPTMQLYTRDLDLVLNSLPHRPENNLDQIVANASSMYYAYERIHPFYDGNGRTGRMILKRILKGSGVRDVIWYTHQLGRDGRSIHLSAMSAVDQTGNQDFFELYLLQQIFKQYTTSQDKLIQEEIFENMSKRYDSIRAQQEIIPIRNIWVGFDGLALKGNE